MATDGYIHYSLNQFVWLAWFARAQLALFYAAAQIEGPNLNLEPLPESLQSQIEAAVLQSSTARSPRRNSKQFSSTLTELEIDHESEVTPFESSPILKIEIVISKIAIEFNGPSHYVRCVGLDVESGTTKFKRRLLGKLGFTVVSVRKDEWRKAREANTQQEFLRKLLQ